MEMELVEMSDLIARNAYKVLTLLMAVGFVLGLYEGTVTNNGAEIALTYLFGVIAVIGGCCWIYDLRSTPCA